MYARVYIMREELLQAIFESENQVRLVDLPISSGPKTIVIDIFHNQNLILDYLSGITDFETSEAQMKISQFAHNVEQMAVHEGILYEPEINFQLMSIKKKMTEILKKSIMSPTTRAKFVGKVYLQ